MGGDEEFLQGFPFGSGGGVGFSPHFSGGAARQLPDPKSCPPILGGRPPPSGQTPGGGIEIRPPPAMGGNLHPCSMACSVEATLSAALPYG